MIWQARNRRLASDLQALQQQLKAKDDALGQMQERLASLEQGLKRKAALVQILERDLLQASQTEGSQAEASQPAASEHAEENGTTAAALQGATGGSASLLNIITSQRDRFRGRCHTLPPLMLPATPL